MTAMEMSGAEYLRRRSLEPQSSLNLGDAEMLKKEYAEAIGQYSVGLAFIPDNVQLLSSRAFAMIKADFCDRALVDVDKVLYKEPKHEKCLYRKVQALWGLQRYEEALQFAKMIPHELATTKPEFQSLEDECQRKIEQSKGIYSLDDIFKDLGPNDTFAEYMGPVKIADVPGKGRGMLATADIQPGQLLLCSKAFTYVLEEDAKKHFETTLGEPWCSMKNGVMVAYCVAFVARKLALQPKLRQSFFDLTAAPSREPVPTHLKTKTTEADSEDISFIIPIVQVNGYRGEVDGDTNTRNSLGVWIHASYLNHSCMEATAHYMTNQAFIFLRAAQEIKKGQEITIPYLPSEYTGRREFIAQRNFICGCKLCLMEDSETSEVRAEVKNILDQIEADLVSGRVDMDTQVSRVRKLISLRKDFPKTNLALLDPIIGMVWNLLVRIGVKQSIVAVKVAAEILESVYEVAESCSYPRKAAEIASTLIERYLDLEDKENASKWMKNLKLSLIRAYGSIEGGC